MSEVIVSEKNLDDILKSINQLDINDIQLDAETLEFFKTVQAYLHCFDTLEALYEEVDPTHKLANYDMPDIKLAIQQLSRNGEPVKNLPELYEVAESMFPVFAAKIEALLEQANKVQAFPPGENKLKGKQRASEKAQDDYSKKDPGPPESWLYDIVRGSVLFDNAEQLFEFLELLRSDESIVIVKSKNRFRNPTLSGYRDFNLQIQITNDDKDGISNRKHICELQVHINAIKVEAKKLKSHHHYEFLRKYYSGATDSLEERMNDLRVICNGGALDMAFLANVIQNPLDVNHMTRLADLFADYMNEYQLAIMMTNAIKGSLEPGDWYNRIGTLLWRQGKLNEAIEMQYKALDIRLKSLGPEHADVGQSYDSIATILRRQDKLDEAMEHYRMALDIMLEVHGLDHTEVAGIYNNMGNVVSDQRKWEEAMELYQKALVIQLKAYGPDHTDVAMYYNNIAIVLQLQGKLDEAMDLYQKSLGIRLKVLGPDHTDVAHSYNNMASVLQNQGKLEEALGLYQKAAETRLKALGPEHTRVADSYNNMALVRKDQGKLEEAMDLLYQMALDIQLKALGPGHTGVARIYLNMAAVRKSEGNLEETMDLYQRALDIQLKALGQGHTDVASSYISMALVRDGQGNLEEALDLYRKSLGVRLQALGPDHTDVAESYSCIGYTLYQQGRLEEALENCHKALDIYVKTLGENHFHTANTLHSIGEILCKQGKLEEATQFGEKALEVFLKVVIGPDHPYTTSGRELMDSIHEQSNKQ